jgi:hypothetical protein
MAKQQTFLDKTAKKGAGHDLISVKVISFEKSENGSTKYMERFVKVKDLNEVEATVKAQSNGAA